MAEPANDNFSAYRGPRVLCQATVDSAIGCHWLLRGRHWQVTVTGLAPHDQTRVYTIKAKSDTLAAQEGIRRFVAEMEALG